MPESTWLSDSYPIDLEDREASYHVRGVQPDGTVVEGYLGPELIPNSDGRAPYRAVDIRGLTLEPGEIREVELEVGEIAETDIETMNGAGWAAYLLARALRVSRGRAVGDVSYEQELRYAGKITRKIDIGAKRPLHVVIRTCARSGSKIVDWSIKLAPTWSFEGTDAMVAIPALWLEFEDPNDAPEVIVDYGIERGAGEPLPGFVFLQPDLQVSTGQPVTLWGSMSIDPDAPEWKHRKAGGAELLAHASAQYGNYPPYGALGGQLHPADDHDAERERVRRDFEGLLASHRAEVAEGGFGTRNVFSDPGIYHHLAVVCHHDPSGQGSQGGFGHSIAPLLYADGRGFPYAKRILRFFGMWEAGRPMHWREAETGRLFNPLEHPAEGFVNGMPSRDVNVCPTRLGMGDDYQGFAGPTAGGLKGYDAQHFSVQPVAQLVLHDMSVEWREVLDAYTVSYLAERVSGADPSDLRAKPDATRSGRAERALAHIFALTGQKEIAIRFAERLPIYARPGPWDVQFGYDPKQWVPFIEAARRGLPIVRIRMHAEHGSQLMRVHSPEWEMGLGMPGWCDMTRVIRQVSDAVERARSLGVELDLGETLLRDFEKACGMALTQWLTETFGSSLNDVTKGLALPPDLADGWPDGAFDPNNLYDDRAKIEKDTTKLRSSSSHLSDWMQFVLGYATSTALMCRIEISADAGARAVRLLEEGRQAFLKTPARHRGGFAHSRNKWVMS